MLVFKVAKDLPFLKKKLCSAVLARPGYGACIIYLAERARGAHVRNVPRKLIINAPRNQIFKITRIPKNTTTF